MAEAEVFSVVSSGDDEPTEALCNPGSWPCSVCTFHNPAAFLACTMCGSERANPGGGAVDRLAPDAAAVAAEAVEVEVGEAAVALGAEPTPSSRNVTLTAGSADAGAAAPRLTGSFTLDCGCRLPAAYAQAQLRQPAAALPASLPLLARHFLCPRESCQQPMTRRDLEALLGPDCAAKMDRHMWAAAAAAARAAAEATELAGSGGEGEEQQVVGEEEAEVEVVEAEAEVVEVEEAEAEVVEVEEAEAEVVDLADSQPEEKVPPRAAAAAVAGPAAPAAAVAELAAARTAGAAGGPADREAQQCVELAGLLLQLHGVLVDSKLPEGAEPAEPAHRHRTADGQSGQGGAAGTGSEPQAAGRKRGRAADAANSGTPAPAQPQPYQQLPWQAALAGLASGGGAGSKQPSTYKDFAEYAAAQMAAGYGYGGDEFHGFEEGEDYGDEDSEGEYEEEDGYGEMHGGDFMYGHFGAGMPGPHKRKQAEKAAVHQGVGFGGGNGTWADGKAAHKQQAEAHRRQHALDGAATGLLQRLRRCLQRWAAAAQERMQPLPLPLLGVLRAGPLAPLLRLLLHNDSLMDVSSRRRLYTEAFGLAANLAESLELVPLLLQPADSNLLKLAAAEEQEEQAATREVKRPRRGKGSARLEAAPPTPSDKAKAAAAADTQDVAGAADAGPAADSSCWQALQALRLQADLFRRNAEVLAGEGNEEDVSLVGAILDVSDCCQRVQEAVELWKASTQQDLPAAPPLQQEQQPGEPQQHGGLQQPGGQQQQQQQQAQQVEDSPELRRRYVSSLKPLLFQSLELMHTHYYRQHAGAAQGGVSDRLRRITKEVSTLPGQLPLTCESGVFCAMDDDRMDVLRAVIMAPPGTPYALGAFAFDILLPPDYPSRPPQVQFLTTGGGKVRFNPNLYQNGKVCLSLLGTWEGPGWQPGQSTLLQVLVSIQSMILGTEHPFFNEPGYARMEGTPQGDRESQTYNSQIRRHTLEVAILGQLQRPPVGFEEVVRRHFWLKAGALKEQVRQWVRADRTLTQLAAQVTAALDALPAVLP
ncbi:hypothetical protein D9Q98_005523 [Chlorella vulgaris]|uniref:Uncharacterized protein n=1 Tax=Chlorella vulgaris TaxID=3077 RepID=A0A9D4YW68_CHLVU|nr:hypothetical protein D9Q98_005523 [Chlorella vulgaris]